MKGLVLRIALVLAGLFLMALFAGVVSAAIRWGVPCE